MPKIDDAKIDEIKAANAGKRLHLLTSGNGEHQIIVRPPTRADWKKFRAANRDDAKIITSREQLVRDCTVFPEKDQLTAIFEELPFLADAWGERIAEIGGLEGEPEKKAL